MKYTVLIMILMGLVMSISATIYDIEVKSIDGEMMELSEYKGKVILIVNTASKCGFTEQYDGLARLYKQYKDDGLVVLGFPANNFLGQEPGTDEEIQKFCTEKFDVTFPMFSKIDVKGKNIHPLYQYLTSKESGHDFGGKITWNFNKFLISRDGKVINRFGTKVSPIDDKVLEEIEKALK